MQTYVEKGDQLEWVNDISADAVSGQVVVIGSLLGVCAVDIADGATGVVNLQGVYSVPKVAGTAWTNGAKLTWDLDGATGGAFQTTAAITPAAGDISTNAVAFGATAEAATTGYAAINRDVGTVETG